MGERSLTFRVLVSLLLVFMLGFGALALYLYDTRDELRRVVMFIQAQEIGRDLTADSDFSRLPERYAGGELSYTLYSADGKPQWHSANLQRPRRLRQTTLQDEFNLFRRAIRSGRVINVPVELSDGHILMVAKEDTVERELIGALLHTRMLRGLVVLLPFCLLAAGLILLLVHWTLRPVRHAAQLATTIGPQDPGRRIPVENLPREILPLAQAANEGLTRLAHAFEYEQRIVADAAHELRTPLTVLDLRLQQCRLEGSADWPAIESELRRVHRLVNQLLSLARQEQAHASQRQQSQQTLLSRLVREEVASILPLFELHGRTIEAGVEDGLAVRGEADLLREVVRNVLENALFHGAGVVTVDLRRDTGQAVILDVGDEGLGVPLDRQEDMFARFRKGSQGGMGSGLGLAIVRRSLRNAGGDARFIGAAPCVLRLWFVQASRAT